MPRPKFKTQMRGLRLTSVPFPAERMRVIAENLLAKITQRISQGMDVHDSPAPPLTPKYAKFKVERARRPNKRDWYLTGITLRHLRVKSARPNRAVIGFLPGVRRYALKSKLGAKTQPIENRSVPISLVVTKNQRRCRQWGVSPSDEAVLINSIQGVDFIQVSKVG